jgi:predicted dehydrogenase
MSKQKLNIAIIGAGYWGKNLVRNFAATKRCNLKYVCDVDENILEIHKRNYPSIKTTKDIDSIINDKELDAVAISTQAPTHFELAYKTLTSGKHTYVEKPLTLTAQNSRELITLANKTGLKLMVGHLLEYHPAVTYLKKMIESGEIGIPYYMYTQRVNLGIVRQDENAWWSLATHDISIICHLLDSEPISVAAQGQCFLQKDIEDVVFATIKFADGKMAHIHCSWLDPHKIRKMTVVGTQKMISFDDMEATEKVRIYDKAASIKHDIKNTYPEIISLRFGNIVIPKVPAVEPLSLECKHFIDCVLDDTPIQSDGYKGLRVVRILEAGQKSLKNNGQPFNPGDF